MKTGKAPSGVNVGISEQQAFSVDVASLNKSDPLGRNALFLAVMQGIPEIVDILLERRVESNGHDHLGRTALHEAVGQNNLIIVSHLLDFGCDVNARTKLAQTPLAFAARFGFVDAAEMLVERGADINAKDVYGRTPMHEAIDGGNPAMVHMLLRHDADLNEKDEHGYDAIAAAQASNQSAIVEMLMRARTARELAAARRKPLRPLEPPAPPDPPAPETSVEPVPVEPVTADMTAGYFDAVLSALPGSVYLLRPDGRFAYVTQTAARRLGLPQDAFAGKQWNDVPLPAEAVEPFELKRQEVVATGLPVTGGLRVHAPQGVFWYDYAVSPVRDAAGALQFVMVALRENSARLELEERLTRAQYALHETEKKLSQERTAHETLEHVVHAAEATERAFLEAGEPLVLLDGAGRVLRANHCCEELSGLNAQDLRRRPFWEVLVAPEDVALAKATVEAAIRGEAHPSCHVALRNAAGTRPRLTWVFTVLHAGDGALEYLVAAGYVETAEDNDGKKRKRATTAE